MSQALRITRQLHFHQCARGRREARAGRAALAPPGKIPRVAKLMALALRFDQLIRDGVVTDQAELARLGRVTRARLTQIMNLLNLAPDIQEELLFLPPIAEGRDVIHERELRPITALADWRQQRRAWEKQMAHGLTAKRKGGQLPVASEA